MSKEFIVHFNEEQGNLLQRLGMEVESKIFLIDKMFANHASDTDTALFDSVPFKHYQKTYEEAYEAFELAKSEFQETYLNNEVAKITGKEKNSYNWAIDDYSSGECKVTLI